MRKSILQLGLQAYALQHLQRGRAPTLASAAPDQGLGHAVRDAAPRVERAGRVLEDHLQLAPQASAGTGCVHVFPAKKNRPGGRRVEPGENPCQRRLPAAGFAHEPERLPPVQLERHAVHGEHLGARLPPRPAPHVKMLLDVANVQQDALRVVDRGRGCGARFAQLDPLSGRDSGDDSRARAGMDAPVAPERASDSLCATQHRTERVSATRTIGGASAHFSSAIGQRSRKAQPIGSPTDVLRRAPTDPDSDRRRSRRGVDLSNRSVYG